MLYKLNEGVTIEEYREWSLIRDQPTLTARDGIQSYRVYDVESSDGSSEFQVVECVEVSDWDTWKEVTSTGGRVPIGDDFARLVDVTSVVALRGAQIKVFEGI